MRETRRTKTESKHQIIKVWSETKQGRCIKTTEQLEVIAAIDGTLLFLEVYDTCRKERHKTYFIKSYLSLSNNLTQAQLSGRYGICRDSAGDYCSMYIEIYESFLRILKELNITYDLNSFSRQTVLDKITERAVQNRKK